MAEDKKKELEDELRALARTAFKFGGSDLLRELEALFTREVIQLRKASGPTFLSDLDPPQHRERYAEIVGKTPAMLRLFSLMEKIAPSSVPVLIQGASGTGKELIARAIHKISDRREREYVTENCAAIPETLLESELFGYKRGAFTGAERNKRGLFEVADGGTLFLDEIGDMSLNMQKKLLRVLQDGEIRAVGGNKVIHVDVRILSASNKNLQELVRQRGFREDLYFRLNTVTLELPDLKDRKEDIPDLVSLFMEKTAKELGTDPVSLSEEAMEAILRYPWPGNIRELENEVRRCMALKGDRQVVGLDDLSEDVKNF